MPRSATIAVVLLVGSLLFRGPPPATSQEGRGLQPADLFRLRSVTDVAVSPDARNVAYSVQFQNRPGQPYRRTHLLDLTTGESEPLAGLESASDPHWSPDGRWLALVGRNDEGSGLFIVRPGGSEVRFLSELEGTNHPLPSTGERLAWSPDGTRIAFISATPGPESADAQGDPVVITRYLYKPTAAEGLTRFNDNRRTHIFAVDIETGEVVQLTDGDFYEHSIDWSPRGDEILFVSNREPDPDRFFNYDVFAVDVRDRSIRRLTATESVEYRPRWSPDGLRVAYQGTERGLTSSETTMEDTHVWVMDRDGGDRREVGGAIDRRQGPPVWSADGTHVYFTVQERGNVGLVRTPVVGGAPDVLIEDAGSVRSWSLGGDDSIVYGFHSPHDLAEVYVLSNSGARQLTDLNASVLDEVRVAKVEPLNFRSFDGMAVEAFLTRPSGDTTVSKHPLIVVIKGGPHSQQGPAFDPKAQIYAARGWATLMVNYRGSTGYGQAFADAIFGDQNGAEAHDVLFGVDAALRRNPWLDRERLGIEGRSYGGQLTNWIITQTDRFRAAIPTASISNLVSFNYMAYYHDYLAVEFGKFPHQGRLMDILWERSPLRHVAKASTPTMLVHGENDNDVPIAEAEQFYIALQDVGVESVMVRYPREGHGIRETRHVVDSIERSIAWYERHFPESEGRQK